MIHHLKTWLPLVILGVLMLAAYASGLHNMVSLEAIKQNADEFQAYADDHPLLSLLLFGLVYTTIVILSLPIAVFFSLLSGFLFGLVTGTFIVVISATIGSTVIFLIAKSSLGAFLRKKAGHMYEKAEHNMKDNAASYLLFMRLVPVFPFFIVNVLPALFNVSLKTFVLTTFFGIIPGAGIYVYTGRTLGEIESLSDLWSLEVAIAFSLLGLVALSPAIYKHFSHKH